MKEGYKFSDGRSYAVTTNMKPQFSSAIPLHQLVFEKIDEEVYIRFNKAFVGKVEKVGLTYNIQDVFDMEGYFGVKVTPLGAKLCLLEDHGDGDLDDLIASGASWLDKWFVEVKRWEPGVVDNERVIHARLFGLSCHVWSDEILQFITILFGAFICGDDVTVS